MLGRQRGARADGRTATAAQQADAGLIRAVLALGGVPWEEIDDGVQQVRLKLLESGGRTATGTIRSLEAWVSVVASRVAVDWHRARSKDTGLTAKLTQRWTERSSPGSEDERVLAITVTQGLDELPPAQRQLLTLRYYADLTVQDIAAELGVPEGTVKSRLHTAVAALEERLRAREVI
ncbi:RNA polymerase sigma factor [Streptomyces sp. NPDC007088]|uniref:RNA polymerase sigma factor n=1 Tax=Streptomyces sp. NPDC007088 TaxID=3364773 RepID=UPI00368B74B3